ncbi:MAG: AcvB/VirJ family lysyl-phosphatidylglycerol hydrolase [Gemmatimonadaceae bacterium]|jgi:type IV secretory pathway VirJ component
MRAPFARVALIVLGLAAARSNARAQAAALADLPLTEVPATGAPTTAVPTTGAGRIFAVFLTGDGGWVALDQGVSAQLAAAGIPVVGFNQRTYLWTAKTPDQAAADLARIITVYRARWHRDSVLVIGYSRGAGVAPFAVNRLPPHLRGAVKAVVLIGSEHTAGFHFRMRDLLRSTPAPDDVPLMPEIQKLGATPLACFYGADEADTICPDLAPPAVVVKMSGGHHLDGAYGEIGRRILGLLK